MKNFVTALDKEGPAFSHLREEFGKLREAKQKEGTFVAPQIRKLLKDEAFDAKLSESEFPAWSSFKAVINKFLGNKTEANYVTTVSELLDNYKNMDCRMSLKLHFLHHTFTSFLKTWVLLVMNRVNAFTTTF
jgi:hypothetical protein